MHRLRNGRFSVWVVSDVRSKAGHYIGLPRDTELAHERASALLYNQAILVNSAGTLALRTGKQMTSSRKLGRRHQEVLCFAKGSVAADGWDYEREAPPSPQLALQLDTAPARAVEVAPPRPTAATTADAQPAEPPHPLA